jgi:hypothetical protein
MVLLALVKDCELFHRYEEVLVLCRDTGVPFISSNKGQNLRVRGIELSRKLKALYQVRHHFCASLKFQHSRTIYASHFVNSLSAYNSEELFLR